MSTELILLRGGQAAVPLGGAVYISGLIAGPDTSKTIAGSVHGYATAALLVAVYDNASPRNAIEMGWTVDPSSFDVVVTFAVAQSDYYVVINGASGVQGAVGPAGTTGAPGTGFGTVTHTPGALTANLPMFGNAADDAKVGTKSGNTNEVATVSGSLTSGHVLVADANGNVTDGGAAPAAGSVTHTGGALTADLPVFGAGTADLKVGTKSGNTDEVATVSGALTSGNAVKSDASGNLVDAGGAPVLAARNINTTAPITGGGDLSADRTIAISTMGADTGSGGTKGAVAAPGAGDAAAGKFWRADATWAVPGGGGALVLLESHTASNSATLDFTAWYSSAYDVYLIVWENLLPVTNAQTPYLRCSTNGGSTYDAAANYQCSTFYFYYGGSGAANGPTSAIGLNTGNTENTAANGGANGWLRLINPGSSSIKKMFRGETVNADSTQSGAAVGGLLQGRYNVTTAVNAFRILFPTGNIASGIGYVYGLAK
jgi:hypothetical protein